MNTEVSALPAKASARVWLKALRAHQWLKNSLVFLPLLTSFSFLDPEKIAASLACFLLFCITASATYLLNDVGDLSADRQHPRKRHRPIAAGVISIHQAITTAAVMLLLALAATALFLQALLLPLLAYLVVTTAYSLKLKQHVLADCIALAILYTLRVLAGAAVLRVVVTPWLLAFCIFIFLSLAVLKRCAELVLMQSQGRSSTQGRDYQVIDLTILWPLGVAASMAAVVIFGLFINDVSQTDRYGNAGLLWSVGLGLIYWLGRLWIKTVRGEMHDDPIVHTLKDPGSRLVMIAMCVATVVAYFV